MPELPPPLPPGERTVGQLIAESVRLYGDNFWRALPLGVPLAVVDQTSVHQDVAVQMVIYWAATPLFVAAYIWACVVVHRVRPTRVAALLAVLIYLPFPALRSIFILPGVAWLAFVGLAVPAALVEGTGFRDSLVRGRQLGTADFIHTLGSLATLVIVVGVSEATLAALLHSVGESGQRLAVFTSDVVLSPLLYLGPALLYLDQAARIGSARSDRRSRADADLHPPVDPDTPGRPDPQVEP